MFQIIKRKMKARHFLSVLLLVLSACTAKENPANRGSSSSLDLTFTPSSLEIAPGQSAKVTYTFTVPVVNPQILVIPVDGLESTVSSGGQSGTITFKLSTSVTVGNWQVKIHAIDGDKSVQKEIQVRAKTPDPVQPVDPHKRRIRTIKVKEQDAEHYVWFQYNKDNKVSKATLSQSGKYTYSVDYSYPTQSSIVANIGSSSMTFFISGDKLLSITEDDGDRMSFEYDASGRITGGSWGTFTWSGDDLVSINYGYDFVQELSYSSSPDKYGFSFLLAQSQGDLDELDPYVMVPILSTLSGINSAHLLQGVRFTGSGASGWPISGLNFDYSIDAQGYPKTLLTDNGFTIYIWYTDEPESADENLGGSQGGGGGGEQDGPVTGTSAWSVLGAVLDSSWDKDFHGVDLGGGIVALKNVKLTVTDQFKWRKNESWTENYGGNFVSLNQGFSVSMDADNIVPRLSGSYDLYLNTTLQQAAVCTSGASPTWGSSSSGGIQTVSGAQFLAASPSSTQLYRLRGAIGYISNSTYGNVTICTEDGSYIDIYGISSSPIGYGGTPDCTFTNHRLRIGDEVVLVGYASLYNNANEMKYGYLESSYRLQASDFAGTYTLGCDMFEYEDTNVQWTGVTVEVPATGYMLFKGLCYNKDDDFVDTFSAALGEYDDATGTVKLLDGWYNTHFYWWFNDNPEQKYISIFYTVQADNSKKSYTWANSDLVLRPTGQLRESREFGFIRGGSEQESQYIFLDRYYNPDSDEVGEGKYRSSIFQFCYMIKDSSTQATSLPMESRSIGKAARNGNRPDAPAGRTIREKRHIATGR